MTRLSLFAADVAALVVDNAVARKDALVLGRQRGALVALAVAAVAAFVTAGAVGVLVFESVGRTAYSNDLFAHGRTLTAAVFAVALALASLLVPALASTSLVSERESGTLRLLLTTALTPRSIVAGKLLALFHGVASPLLLCLPLLAGGALLGAVTLVDVVVATALLVVNVVALASVGLAASATSERVRAAPARGLATAALFVWGPIGLPSLAMVIVWVMAGYHAEMWAGAALIAGWAAVVVVGSLYVAEDALSPLSSRTRGSPTAPVVCVLLGAPVLAVVSLGGLVLPVDIPVWSSLYLLGWGALLFVVVVADGAGVARRGGSRDVWRVAARNAWVATAGLTLAALVARFSVHGVTTAGVPLVDVAAPTTALAAAAPLALWLAIGAAVTAWYSRRVEAPLRRTMATAVTLAALWIGPAVIASVPLLAGLVPLVDPASLVYGATGGVIDPFDTPWLSTWDGDSLGTVLLVHGGLLLGLLALAFRERVLTRR